MKKDTNWLVSDEASPQEKLGKLVPKIDGIQGALEERFVKCGRKNCKCAKGELHGPYFYHRYRSKGRRRKRYVKESELEALRAGIEEYRSQRAEIIEANKYLRGRFGELKARFRDLRKRMRTEGFDV